MQAFGSQLRQGANTEPVIQVALQNAYSWRVVAYPDRTPFRSYFRIGGDSPGTKKLLILWWERPANRKQSLLGERIICSRSFRMRTTLICCLLLNLAVILASGALLQWFPSQQGFTITTPHATHYISGDIFLSAALLCLVDSVLGIYLAWWLLHPR